MKNILLIILLSTLSIFSWALTLDEIENLSKNPATLELSWEYFLEYIIENPSDARITDTGSLISAKISLFNKYRNYNFANFIISEDLKNFCINLGVIGTNFSIPEDDTNKILFIFPEIVPILNNIFNTGNFEESYYKYLYKLEGLKEHLQVNSYETFIKTTISNSLSSPIYFDEDVEKFIEVFVPANNYILFEKFISESKYLVDEDKYLGAYKLLTFLNKHNSINESIFTYSQLKNYFSLKQKLTSLNDQVFFVEKQELSSFISEVYKVGEDLKALTIEKNLLYNIFLPLLKALNSKLENIQEKVPVVDENFENLSFSFNEQINAEILKLQMHITRIENLPIVVESDKATLVEQPTDSQEASARRIFVYFLLSILGTFIVIFLYFELYPSYSKINFLCTLKLGRYAAHLAEKLILKNPEDYKAFLILAKSYEVAGKYNASINAYKTALKLKDKTKEGE
ncbi:hypothetical protein CN13_01850 [Petrotoga sp. HKA.pet.4.5]|uniref:tetratricopeptide repeat protein n=1 Tax=unclassified Petrotoga TaxID=2620614 RepID=UPI000EF133CA|nr:MULTISPECIES: tetratricopeptide repeat protein [unclassified Petrotoga]RLL83922.1 hypothetical protein BZ25_05850 [Petrotoga sp. Shatin.DS.tank11.9.2.9.3]RLL90185.1 hypothetical protein CN13_01850 [Petrotoga sp. HKA.pet.4.5]